MVELYSDRLGLRPLTGCDLDALAEIYQDPEVMRYRVQTRPATHHQTEVMLAAMLAHWEQHGFGRWALMDRYTFKLIGHAGLEFIADTPEIEVNYLLARSHWGRGLATEAARVILNYGFVVRQLNTIVAIAKPDNRASIRVMEKLGMTYDCVVNYHNTAWVRYRVNRDQWNACSNGSAS